MRQVKWSELSIVQRYMILIDRWPTHYRESEDGDILWTYHYEDGDEFGIEVEYPPKSDFVDEPTGYQVHVTGERKVANGTITEGYIFPDGWQVVEE